MIRINLAKAREVAHAHRRAARSAEFAPLDDIIAKRLPDMTIKAAEAARQDIRDRYDAMQVQIDEAENTEALAAIVASLSADS